MSKDIVVYPNPTRGKLTVFTDRDPDSFRIIKISGEDGKIVYQRILERNENRLEISLETDPGLYLIQIICTDGKANAMKKIVLIK
ncbi:MAG: T9SS type A sorting domain-containing protein [Bacteroidales bacterium]